MTDDKLQALNLLKTARGQISGVIGMIEEGRYCVDISKQLLAVEALVKKSNIAVLKGHINTCVRHAFEQGDSEEKVDEVMGILEKYLL